MTAPIEDRTPRGDGLSMPAEWEPHQACLIAWPTSEDLWLSFMDQAKDE